jgi:cytochrome P450
MNPVSIFDRLPLKSVPRPDRSLGSLLERLSRELLSISLASSRFIPSKATPGLEQLPHEPSPAPANAARYWLDLPGFIDRLEGLGDRFVVTMPGSGAWVGLTAPDDIEKVFRADTEALYFGEALRMLSPHELVLGPTNLTALDGPEHLATRRLLLPAFHGEALNSYEATIEQKAREAAADWPVGGPTPAIAETSKVTLEVIMAAVFGVTEPERLERLRDAVLELIDELGSRRFLLETAIATARRDGFSRPFPRIEERKAAVDAIVLEEIAERRAGGGQATHDDVLGKLLAVRDDQGEGLGDPELCDQMRLMLIGGTDTTATTIAWALDLITHDPRVLRELTRSVKAGDEAYLTAVVQETLRMRPAFPFTVRLTKQPLELDGLTIPEGTIVAPFITLVHRRPDIYPDPLEFRPERFLGTRPGTYSWIPFGGGMRRCIGASMAQLEATVVLRTLIEELDLRPAVDESAPIGRHSVIAVPNNGAPVVATRRRPAGSPKADSGVRS